MLVLSRRAGERIKIDRGSITITIMHTEQGRVMVGIDAPKDIDVHREEVFHRMQRNHTNIGREVEAL